MKELFYTEVDGKLEKLNNRINMVVGHIQTEIGEYSQFRSQTNKFIYDTSRELENLKVKQESTPAECSSKINEKEEALDEH